MTLDELSAREAIRDTIAKYTTSGDRLKAQDLAACFTEDGIIESEGVPDAQRFRYEGRAAILAWQNRWREPSDVPITKASFARHHLSTSKIDLIGADAAQVRTYWAAWTDIGPDHAGYYLDLFRKVDEDWLIAHRRIRLDWESPQSLFGGAVTNTNAG